MEDLFDQIERSVQHGIKKHFQEDPVESLKIEIAPHPDSEEGQLLVQRIFDHYRAYGYPHVRFNDKTLHDDFQALQNQQVPIQNDCLRSNMVGLRIVNMFHPIMDQVPCRGYRTALQVFQNDDFFKGAIRKMLLHAKEPGRTVGNRIRIHLLSYSRVQAVSNFRPGSAKSIYDTLEPNKVLDFSMGWGGRLLAALAGGYSYIGIDPSIHSYRGNQAIRHKIRTLFPNQKFEARLIRACAEDVLGTGMFQGVDLICTSPPYFNAEQYEDSPHQSFQRYPTQELWYTGFLQRCLEGSFKDLADGGHLVINVNPDMAERTIQYATGAGFTHTQTWWYLLSLRQQNKKHDPSHVRGEPTFVFRKGSPRKPTDGSTLDLFG